MTEIRAAYLAAEGFEAVLAEELARRGVEDLRWHGRLALSEQAPVAAAWALDVWTDPRLIAVASIKSAADALRAMQRNWDGMQVGHFRRAALIAARLPPLRGREFMPGDLPPVGHLGGWTLLEPELMLASPTKTSPFVGGVPVFVEDRIGPPSRAYLKLWEACLRFGEWPAAGARCIDLGASPGGWSWALAALGAEVLAVDRAPLDPRVAAMAGVNWCQGSAFAMAPERCDWMFSDIIAYPQRLLELVQGWIDAGAAGRIICTLKFQGATDHAAAEAFAAIPGGRVLHLAANKHELTFLWREDQGRGDQAVIGSSP